MLVDLGPDSTSHVDGGVAPLTSYTYRVRAVGPTLSSAATDEIGVRTPARPLSFVLASEDTLLYRVGVAPVTSPTAILGVGYANACSLTPRADARQLLALSPGARNVLLIDLGARRTTTIGYFDQPVDSDHQGLARSSGGVLYGVFGVELRTIDPVSWGSQTVATLTGAVRVEALVFDAQGRLLASGSDGPDASAEALYEVDLATGQLTRIGFYGVPDIDDLTIGEDGGLYGIDGQSSTTLLYQIDPLAGTARLLSDTGIRNARGLAAATFTEPRVVGHARLLDGNHDAQLGVGDRLIVPFDQAVTVIDPGVGALSLLVEGDGFGSGATVIGGPAANEVTVQLGAGARLRTRGAASVARTGANSPSGVDATTGASGPIRSTSTGVAAVGSLAFDIAPGFVPTGTLTTGHNRRVAMADLDADGDLDLITADDGAPNRVWRNDGAGGLSDTGQRLGNDFTLALAIGDVDRDGDQDLFFGNNQQADTLWLNDGAAGFSDAGLSLGVGETTLCALMVDLDRDGDLDLVAGSRTAVHVYAGDGRGGFTETQTLSTSAISIVSDDLDRDGVSDLAVLDLAGTVGIYLTDGAGALHDSGARLGQGLPRTVCVGDFDRDGDADLIVGYADRADPMWLNDGSGAFVPSGRTLLSDTTWQLVAGDVDLDGALDLVEACGAPSARSRLWMNDGQGGFVLVQDLELGNSLDVAAGDLDRDGDLDLVFGEGSTVGATGRVTVWRGSTSGTWGRHGVKATGRQVGMTNSVAFTAADFDRDADRDVLLGGGNHATLPLEEGVFLRNDGAGQLTIDQRFAAVTVRAMSVFDLDRDGDLDVLRSTTMGPGTQEVRFLVNDGAGLFGLGLIAVPSPAVANDISVADLDRDGHDDLVVTYASTSSRPDIYRSDGAGAYVLLATLPRYSSRMLVGDMNKDGWPDLVAPESGAYMVYLNRRDGTFQAGNARFPGGGGSFEELVDADRDGDLDLLTVGLSSAVLMTNDGTGSLTAGAPRSVPHAFSLIVGDLDGDGDIDYGTYGDQGQSYLYFNDGAGAFSAPLVITIPGERNGSPEFIDLDRDGDLDIYVRRFDRLDTVLLND